ncbi:Uncharacterised protein [Vibrio cholerae]|nr:Uncharacterised protein [Vibrio cholerae]
MPQRCSSPCKSLKFAYHAPALTNPDPRLALSNGR